MIPPESQHDPGYTPDRRISRRHLFRTAPIIGLAATVPATGATAPKPPSGSQRIVSVTDFGAQGDGRHDDTVAFFAALAAAQVVDIPPGSFLLRKPLVIDDGQTLRGTGAAGWEPYTGSGAPASAIRSEIVIGGHVAIDARNSNNATVTGLAIRAEGAHQSEWGGAPGFRRGAIGVDIAGALQFSATDLSFHGLEIGVSAVAGAGATAQMPRIGQWAAQDCGTVFRFVSPVRTFDAVRDARIDGCIAALHCERIIEVRNCDGLRVENVRFYQCTANSILIENTPFVAITGATLFETGEETLVLRGCHYATIAGAQVCRTGYYRSKPLLQRAAVVLDGCSDVSFEGLVEQSVGRAFSITDCRNLSINAAIGTPFWSTGSLASNDGAIRIERSRAITINASFGGTDYWLAIWCDSVSAPWISGRIATEGPPGVLRCVPMQSPPLGHVTRTTTSTMVPAGASLHLDDLRILVPPSTSLVSRSIELTQARFVFFAGNQAWGSETTTELGGGSLSLDSKVLHHNDGAEPRYAEIAIGVRNLTDRALTLPAGHEIRLSLALERPR